MGKGLVYSSVISTDAQSEAGVPGKDSIISKEISFEIEQDYEACEFEIAIENTGDYEVLLYREGDHAVWTQNISDGNICAINVSDVKKGKWMARVTLSDSAESSMEEESLASEETIGKVKVSVRAIDKTAFLVGNVEGARDIAGLTEYLKDDAIVVEWSDSSCGNVNISIIDAKTSQILDRQTVEGRYYEFRLPALTEEIIVDVVPATSEGISGANRQRVINADYLPEATILYEDRSYTNKDEIPVEVTLEEPYSLLFMNNDAKVKHTGILPKGTYTFDIPVNEGQNDILTYVVDSEHNMRSTAYSVIRDSVKPALTLDMEYDGMKTYDDMITVTGTIRDYESFTVNEVKPVVAGDGSFKAEYILKDGENILNIRAADIAENETLYKAVIVKEIKKSLPVYIYMLPVVLILTAAFVLFICKTKKKFWQRIKKGISSPFVQSGKKKWKKPEMAKWQKTVAGMFFTGIIVYVLFTKVLMWGIVPSESMEPFLNAGDYVIINGLAYVNHKPQRGDVIVFSSHDKSSKGQLLIKRVIGIPGDKLSFADVYLYINSELVYEEYLGENIETNSASEFEVTEGCYFVMGDNREKSVDSRFWEEPCLSGDEIKGKLLTVIPVKKIKKAMISVLR